MTPEDILRMAEEAGFDDYELHGMLLRFAALVAAHEREACAKVAENHRTCTAVVASAIRARGEKP